MKMEIVTYYLIFAMLLTMKENASSVSMDTSLVKHLSAKYCQKIVSSLISMVFVQNVLMDIILTSTKNAKFYHQIA